MNTLEDLAWQYTEAKGYHRRLLIATALVNVDLDKFIDTYKDGWLGDFGAFARDLARIREVV